MHILEKPVPNLTHLSKVELMLVGQTLNSSVLRPFNIWSMWIHPRNNELKFLLVMILPVRYVKLVHFLSFQILHFYLLFELKFCGDDPAAAICKAGSLFTSSKARCQLAGWCKWNLGPTPTFDEILNVTKQVDARMFLQLKNVQC